MDCRICNGISRKKCIFCGRKPKRKRDMTDKERLAFDSKEEEIKWLTDLRNRLIALKQRSTGCATLDERIKKQIGSW